MKFMVQEYTTAEALGTSCAIDLIGVLAPVAAPARRDTSAESHAKALHPRVVAAKKSTQPAAPTSSSSHLQMGRPEATQAENIAQGITNAPRLQMGSFETLTIRFKQHHSVSLTEVSMQGWASALANGMPC